MRLVFFGTPEFAIPTLETIIGSRHQLDLVISRPDKPVGRRKILTPPPVAAYARERGLELIQPKSLKTEEVAERISRTGADAAVVVAFGRLIPPALLRVPPKGMINLHPSLLPRHRGPSPIQWALVSGDRRTGVTTMLLDEGMDTGPILLQRATGIGKNEMAADLGKRLAAEGASLVVETLDGFEAGAIQPQPQPDEGITITPMIRREFGKIAWEKPAFEIFNRFRGLSPWPGLYTFFRGGRLKIHGLELLSPAPDGKESPGTILEVSTAGLAVRCGPDSAVLLTELQREGRRRMPADAFLIGERVSPGEQLG